MKLCKCGLFIDVVLCLVLSLAIGGIIGGYMMDWDNLFFLFMVMVALPIAWSICNRNLIDSIRRQHDIQKAKREIKGYELLSTVVAVLSGAFTMIASHFVKGVDSPIAALVISLGLVAFVAVAIHYYRELLKYVDEEKERIRQQRREGVT